MIESKRKSELGRFGEMVVCERLAENGLSNCARIAGVSPCYDIQAYKNGRKYLFLSRPGIARHTKTKQKKMVIISFIEVPVYK